MFARLPQLRVVLVEGGFGWLPSLMWRLDKHWARLRGEVPHLTRPPSEYVREHVWVTTQPIDEPSRPQDFTAMLEQMDMDDHILFATDYPHWDFDAPDRALPQSVPPALREAIVRGNAHALYRLSGPDGTH